MSATASDTDGSIAKVEFFDGPILIATATAAPYSASLANPAAGSHLLSARATDDRGGTTSSSTVSVRVDAGPTVSLTAPANNALFSAPATIALSASASDADGTIAKVEFFQGGTLVGSATAAPYTATVSNLGSGLYSFTAVATDNDGAQTTSAAVNVTVNALPAVAITSPAGGASFSAPANIPISVSASDPDGSISRVELYSGASLVTTLTQAPYSFTWTNVPTGSYALIAKAFDNSGGQSSSAQVTVTVQQRTAGLYFVHVDHLNTPRLVTNQSGQTVWRWDQQEPFGVTVPDENPSGLGTFEFPLRFPGQYADKETSLHYNYLRDYDAVIGRYLEPDPLGVQGLLASKRGNARYATDVSELFGMTTLFKVDEPMRGEADILESESPGVHLYAHVAQDPLRRTDPTGELALVVPRSSWLVKSPENACLVRCPLIRVFDPPIGNKWCIYKCFNDPTEHKLIIPRMLSCPRQI